MRMVLPRTYLRAIVLARPLVAAASASGGEIQVSVTNNQLKGGFALSNHRVISWPRSRSTPCPSRRP
jgi:hypothetical protein